VSEHLKDNKNIRSIAFKLFIFFVAVYLLTSSGPNFNRTDASLARYHVTQSIVERFDLSIPDGYGIKGADGWQYHSILSGNASV
jgi:hypothetical protein